MDHLTVVAPFADYARGARITEAADVKAVLADGYAGHVVRVPVRKSAATEAEAAEVAERAAEATPAAVAPKPSARK